MNRDEAIRRAEMLKQYIQGENQYQFTTGSEPTLWQDVPDWSDDEIITTAGIFFDDYYQIRIKPKPLEDWQWWEKEGSQEIYTGWTSMNTSKPEPRNGRGRWVRMREIDE